MKFYNVTAIGTMPNYGQKLNPHVKPKEKLNQSEDTGAIDAHIC